jgi:1,4-alpha-glucan branching enzyme
MSASPVIFRPPSLNVHPCQILRLPVPDANEVAIRFAPLQDRDRFAPLTWRSEKLERSSSVNGIFQVDLRSLNLMDGTYEYEFVVDGDQRSPIADPFADEIVRFGGYRSVFRIQNRQRVLEQFSWTDEFPAGETLPENNEVVIYELPLRWVGGALDRQVGLGTFDDAIFEHLDDLAELGINAIELLPSQDSSDTINWGYGTRFFYAPDLDLGTPLEMKFFVKACHQRGIRVLLDVVMNHSRKCPLEQLAGGWYYLSTGNEEGDRPDWGGRIFRYAKPIAGSYHAREFHYQMAEHWISQYRIDGFRIDEFKGINNWDFIQQFCDRAWAEHSRLFPDRPFLVIAEDSWCRSEVTKDLGTNPNGHRVVDAIWNFSFQAEMRRLLTNELTTAWGQSSRRDRIDACVSGEKCWDAWLNSYREGFSDLANNIIYFTSHDVQQAERMMTLFLQRGLRQNDLGDGSLENIRQIVDQLPEQPRAVQQLHASALERAGSAFALLLTSVGIPMFLAGEEHGDVHDLPCGDWRLKMSDPVDWGRSKLPTHAALRSRVKDLIELRTSHAALQRNEVEFFYFHPEIDEDRGARVFAYCRTAGKTVGRRGQVIVVANLGEQEFPVFDIPWPWRADSITERAPSAGSRPTLIANQRQLRISLAPFQVRVFSV